MAKRKKSSPIISNRWTCNSSGDKCCWLYESKRMNADVHIDKYSGSRGYDEYIEVHCAKTGQIVRVFDDGTIVVEPKEFGAR